MQVSLHAISDAASPDTSPSAAAIVDNSLGLAAVADAEVSATLLEQDLGAGACQLALEAVRAHIRKQQAVSTTRVGAGTPQAIDLLRTAVGMAAQEVNALARRRGVEIQLTLDMVLMTDAEACVCHVGDGRVYLVRKGLVHKLTQDHIEGEGTEGAEGESLTLAAVRPRLTRSLGGTVRPEPETLCLQLTDGDRVVIASPWLHRGLDDLRIREAVNDPMLDGVTARMLGITRSNGIRRDLAVALMSIGGLRRAPDRQASRLATLARIPLFAYCTERELLAIAGVTRPIRYRSGNVVFREGDPGQGMYLVVGGKVAILKDDNEITRLGPGANFGEMSMLDEPRRSATVRAVEDAELLLITRDAFFSLLKRDPTLAVKVLWNMLLRISAHLRSTSEQLARLTGGADRPLP
ncbi:MAG: cyclic nucleotide-binding domain-containing protein [Alphaproteobacteria bacterium]|nr:cyclic nucleotide-binding domain-containing protein [Alphaproteobacteria bacterium]